jgi:cell division protein FtsQ
MRLGLRRPGAGSRGSRPPKPPPRPVSVHQYRRRRLAAALLALFLVVGVGLTGRVLLYDLGLADVAQVTVTGAATIPVRQVMEAAAVTPGGPLAAVDLAAVAGRVARLPAVESTRVRRAWPHTVAVDITERVPVAVTRDVHGPALVDRTGVVYPGEAVPGLPTLSVPWAGTDDPATLAAVAVLAALPEPVRAEVRTVTVPSREGLPGAPPVTPQVTLGLTGDREVRWGAAERAADKVAVLVPLLGQAGRRYDVSSPELPTIRPCSTQSAAAAPVRAAPVRRVRPGRRSHDRDRVSPVGRATGGL